MISITIILVLIIAVVAFFIFFKILRGFLKALGVVVLLLLFVSMVLGFFVYLDAGKIKGSIGKEQTILLSHKGNIVAGFKYGQSQDKVLDTGGLGLFSRDQISVADAALQADNLSNLNKEGLIVIIDSSYFYNKSLKITDALNITLDESAVNALFGCSELKSCTDVLVAAAGSKDESFAIKLENSFNDDLDVKNKVFYNLFAEETTKTKGTFLLTGVRTNKIQIYPELMTLKIIKFVPSSVLKLMPGLNDKLLTTQNNSTNGTN